MNGPSTHLTWAELACKDGTPYPDRYLTDGRLSRLAMLFEEIRAELGGQPITVISAYRTPAHNRKIGGAPNSQHLHGRALDIKHSVLLPTQVVDMIKAAREEGRMGLLGGLGIYRTFTHIDVREVEKWVVWSGGGQLKDDRI